MRTHQSPPSRRAQATLAGVALAAAGLTACAPTDATPRVAQRTQRIVMGRVAEAAELLSTVSLVADDDYAFCTGTLVAPTVVITAAHCFLDEREEGYVPASAVTVGVDSLRADPLPAAHRVAVARYTAHPGFTPDSEESDSPSGLGREDDLAVIVLAEAVEQIPTPVLPPGLVSRLQRGTPLTISGYGVTHLDEALDASGRLHIGETAVLERSEHEILAGGTSDTCNGDSGGPAYVTLGGQRYLAGATARAAHDAETICGDRGLYTLVPAYTDWIRGVAGDALGAAEETDTPRAEGDGDPTSDVCDDEGWYDDGECDEGCDQPDPDCEGAGGEAPAPLDGDAEGGDDGGGCSATPTQPIGLGWALLALAPLLRRRRR